MPDPDLPPQHQAWEADGHHVATGNVANNVTSYTSTPSRQPTIVPGQLPRSENVTLGPRLLPQRASGVADGYTAVTEDVQTNVMAYRSSPLSHQTIVPGRLYASENVIRGPQHPSRVADDHPFCTLDAPNTPVTQQHPSRVAQDQFRRHMQADTMPLAGVETEGVAFPLDLRSLEDLAAEDEEETRQIVSQTSKLETLMEDLKVYFAKNDAIEEQLNDARSALGEAQMVADRLERQLVEERATSARLREQLAEEQTRSARLRLQLAEELTQSAHLRLQLADSVNLAQGFA